MNFTADPTGQRFESLETCAANDGTTTRVLLYCNATASAAIKTYLEYKGFEVVAPNGDGSGRYQIQAGEFALAIVDVGVSASAGLGVIKAMRDADAELGIIAISASVLQGVHEPGSDLAVAAGAPGAAQFLSAPFHPSELLQVMNRCLRGRNGPPSICEEG